MRLLKSVLGRFISHYYHPYSFLLPPLDHKHSDIYLQLCIWFIFLVFLIAVLIIIRLLIQLKKLKFDSAKNCILNAAVILHVTNLLLTNCRFEFLSTSTSVLQRHPLIKRKTLPKCRKSEGIGFWTFQKWTEPHHTIEKSEIFSEESQNVKRPYFHYDLFHLVFVYSEDARIRLFSYQC